MVIYCQAHNRVNFLIKFRFCSAYYPEFHGIIMQYIINKQTAPGRHLKVAHISQGISYCTIFVINFSEVHFFFEIDKYLHISNNTENMIKRIVQCSMKQALRVSVFAT